MAQKKVYIGSIGPFLFEDTELLPDASANQAGIWTDGKLIGAEMTMDASGNIYIKTDGTNLIFKDDAVASEIQLIKLENLIKGTFGGLSVKGNTTALTIGFANFWYQVTAFDTEDSSNRTSPSSANDYIEIDHDGSYLISLYGDFQGTANDSIELQIKLNNNTTDLDNLITILTATGNNQPFSLTGIVDLTDGDTVEFWLRNISATNNITIKNATMSLTVIGA